MIYLSLFAAAFGGCVIGYVVGFNASERHWRPQFDALWRRLRTVEGGNDPGPRIRRLK